VNEKSRRQRRVEDLLKEEISRIVQNEINDPRVGFVTVTSIDISPDLRNAKVYVQIYGDEKNRRDSLIGLQRAAPRIRSDIAARVILRFVPEISFMYDESLDNYEHINKLLKDISHGNP
jgi:ribosome-binding factor A